MHRGLGYGQAAMARLFLLAALFLQVSALGATELSDRGIRLFMENKPMEAAPVLELAAREEGADERLYLYLGIAYQQQGKWDEAVAAFRKGLRPASPYTHQFLFNIANSFYAQGRSSFALEYYDQAIRAKPDYSGAYLNRANAKMKLGDHPGAVSDYSMYLGLEPSSPQAGEIRRLIDLLGAKTAEAERLKAEAEARALAEERARQALLDEVTRTLLEAAETTTNLSAGSGDVEGYETDLSLDD